MKNIDLHMHSAYSTDGTYSVKELFEIAKKNNVNVMAITDHNVVKANEEANILAKEYGITYINGTEIDCRYKNHDLHILAYGIDYTNSIYQKINDNIYSQYQASNKKLVELTNNLGFDVNIKKLDELATYNIYTGEIFAEVLLSDERYLNHEILKPYRPGNERSNNPYVNFYWDYYAKDKPCYIEIELPRLEDIIKIIHETGGIAILAHPKIVIGDDYHLFDEMVALGIDGVECYSSYHDIDTIDYFYNKAKELNVLFTCGSDFHGKTKPKIKMLGSGCENYDEIENNLFKAKLI